jgi:hypothetical protein
MVEYWEREIATMLGEESVPAAGPSTSAVPAYMLLVAQYGIADMEIGNPDIHDQTVEQEYQVYITAPLSPNTIDILKFWEVYNC